jgi:epoxyqueuosine reductase QueG
LEANTRLIISTALDAGASLAGIADLKLLEGLPVYGGLDLASYRCAVSIAVALPSGALELISVKSPGVLYAHAYRTANAALDAIALRVSQKISEKGHRAFVIPASLRIDIEKEIGHASHKAFAWAAGLGWIGRNALLVNPIYGSDLRLATVVTDMPMETATPVKNGCGECRLCVLSCPPKALSYAKFEVRPSSREEILDTKRCAAWLNVKSDDLASDPLTAPLASHICGMCIKVCPAGKRRKQPVTDH